MCSILGLSSNHDVAPTIVESLKKMEYRGYDSVGVAIKNESNISVKKGVGKVKVVNSEIQMDQLQGNTGYWSYKMGYSWRCNCRKCTSSSV